MTITSLDDLKQRRRDILRVTKRWGGRRVSALGAILEADFRSDKKIVLIIEFDRLLSHGQHIRLERALEKLLGHQTVKVVIPEEEPEDESRQMLEEAVPL